MPRYFFHVYNDEITYDEDGAEIPDDSAAREWAKRAILGLAAESIKRHRHLVLHHKIVIADSAGNDVDSVEFGEAIQVIG